MNAFQRRRQKLSQCFPQTAFVIPAGIAPARSHSVHYPYKVPGEFFYLTGLDSLPGSVLVVADGKATLLLPPRSAEAIQWEGELGFDHAQFPGLRVEPLSRLEELMGSLKCDRIAAIWGRCAELDATLRAHFAYARKSRPWSFCDARHLMGFLRLRKDAEEIALLREAARRTSHAFRKVMASPLSGRTEKDVALQIASEFLAVEMHWTAYETIVGAGARSRVLHALPTQRLIADAETVLIDAGGEWQGYCSDITRVLPAGKRFSTAQREVYARVLEVQKWAIAQIKPGLSLAELTQEVRQLLPGMPHGLSHWIGLDVHDPCPWVDDAGEPIRLEPGMTFTVEPGWYAGEFGIRIEDDVLVTQSGCEVLSDAPKEIAEIEALRRCPTPLKVWGTSTFI